VRATIRHASRDEPVTGVIGAPEQLTVRICVDVKANASSFLNEQYMVEKPLSYSKETFLGAQNFGILQYNVDDLFKFVNVPLISVNTKQTK